VLWDAAGDVWGFSSYFSTVQEDGAGLLLSGRADRPLLLNDELKVRERMLYFHFEEQIHLYRSFSMQPHSVDTQKKSIFSLRLGLSRLQRGDEDEGVCSSSWLNRLYWLRRPQHVRPGRPVHILAFHRRQDRHLKWTQTDGWRKQGVLRRRKEGRKEAV